MTQPPSKLTFSRSEFRYTLLAVAILLLTTAPINAQTASATDGATPGGMAAGAPAGSYQLSGFDNINYFNGNMNFNLPLLNVGGRGGVGHSIGLKIEQKWRTIKTLSGVATTWPEPVMWGGLQAGYGPGVLIGRLAGASWANCNGEETVNSLLRLTFVASDGTEYELHDTAVNGSPGTTTYNNCSVYDTTSRGTVFTTSDGNGATFISDVALADGYNGSLDEIYPSGYLKLRDGKQYRINNGLVEWVRDRNGNKMSYEYTSQQLTKITDSLGRVVNISYGYAQSGSYSDTITYRGFGGASRTIRIWHDAMGTSPRSGYTLKTYHDLFPVNGASTSSNFNRDVVTSVELPDGRSYRFKYNSYGELARVELPTGGAFEYDYDGGLSANTPGIYNPGPVNHGTEIYRRVIERRVYADGGAVPQSRMTISKPEDNGGNVGYALVENRDSSGTLLTSEKHFFYGSAKVPFNHQPTDYSPWDQGKEWKIELYDVVNQTLVLRRTVENTWQTLGGPSPSNAVVTQTVTTLADSNQVTKQTFAYDQYGNRSETSEFDFGNGTPGALIRRTHSDYVTASTYTDEGSTHLRSLPSRVSVYDSNNNERARTTYEYDNYTTSDSYHAALKNWPAITGVAISGLDSSFTSSYPYRGNPTATTRYLLVNNQVTSSVTGYAQYDLAGNVVKSIDPRSTPSNIIATTISYDDCFGTPDGNARNHAGPVELVNQRSYAFPTVVTNALNQMTYAQFDYYVGRPVDGEDVNGIISSGYSDNDPMDRPTRVIRAVNGGTATKSQTVFNYDDVNHFITTTSDQVSLGDGVLKSETRYDGLGRTTEQRTYEGGSNYIVVKQEYDALGRSYKTSNPFRPWQSGVERWTITAFDALGRVTSVTSPDSAVISTAYNGNTVTITDQIGKARKSVMDGLGRLTSVYEDPGSLNYQTSYAYDVLDDLTTVTQGSQTRTFVYDSLKRLSSATNPESGAISYDYDSSGNLLHKTDARGVVSTYVYDALNRNTTIDYSDTTINPDITRAYDNTTTGAKGIGRLWYSYAGGNNTTGATVEQTAIDNYDALGRPLVERQLFKTAGSWSSPYQTQRTYDLAGHVKTQTYPSGHTVNYNYDAAGRLGDKDTSNLAFRGNLGDGTLRTYSQGVTYSPFGGLSQEQFGTDTAVYNKLAYNSRGQLAEIKESTVANDSSWNRGKFINWYSLQCGTTTSPNCNAADNNGNLRKQETLIPNNEQNTSSTSWYQQYDYDSLNRLQRVHEYTGNTSLDWQQEYIYDRYGNRTIHQTNTSGIGINKKDFTVNTANNRLGVPGGESGAMTYDAAGNLTTDTYSGAAVTRAYDAENRMTSETQVNFVSGSYSYNANGQRVRRTVGGQPSAVTTWQIYGFDGELLAEYPANTSSSTPQKEYGYRNGQLLITAAAASDQVNVALATSGATGSASSTLGSQTPANTINGDHKGLGSSWWTDNTSGSYPDSLEVDFAGPRTINEIDVYGLQQNPSNPVEPTLALTSSYALTNFKLQYWTTSGWADVPNASVTGNNKVWRKFNFDSLTTSKIQVVITAVAGDNHSQVVEVEAYGAAPPVNVALATTDATTSASSVYGSQAPANVNNGERKGLNYGWWTDNTSDDDNDWVEVDFAGPRTINEIDVIGLQDPWSSPVEPTLELTARYALTNFEVQYWTGSAWVAVPGGSVTGNDKVWRKFTFDALTTSKIKVNVTSVVGDNHTQVVEVEAWTPAAGAAEINWLVTDGLGTPRMIFDKSGTLANVKRHDYLSFGEELPSGQGARATAQGYVADGVRQKFSGKERDNETGLDYFINRYYSSTQGRFTSPDKPFADQFQANPQSWNTYSYVRNAPCNHVDAKGRCSAPSGLKPGGSALCIEAFIAARTFEGVGLGDNRSFSGHNPDLTARVRTDILISGSPGKANAFDITQTTVAAKSTMMMPIPGGVFALQGHAQTALDGQKGESGATTSSSITKSADSDGQLRVNVSTTAQSAFGSVVDLGSISESMNFKMDVKSHQMKLDQNSKATGYPSIAAYGYYMDEKGKTVETELVRSPEGSPDDLKKGMKDLPSPPR